MYEHVFAPGAIGQLALSHRIVMGSMHLGVEGEDDDGRVLAAFYAERAAAGAGLIVTGGAAVSRVGAAGRQYAVLDDPADRSKLARVAEAVHAAGGRILLQLFHAGRYGEPSAFGLQPVAPSPVYAALVRAEPRELSAVEVEATIADFAAGAERALALGYDGVEIMGSEGYLLNQFTAPATNRRDDAWGGDPQRRLAFPLAVAAAVRAGAGSTAAVVYRISGADLVPDGTPWPDTLALAAGLADVGVDALNVGIGWHESRVPTVQLLVPAGSWTPWARALRAAVPVPVITSNRVTSLALADTILGRGDADFVSLARPFLADPEIVAKGREALTRTVNVCIGCDQACVDRSIFDRRVSCLVNPRAGFEREYDGAGIGRAVGAGGVRRRVAVAGGGPAGMAAARALALAGHVVVLHEAGAELGGQFRMAARIPGKGDYARTVNHYAAELARLGVEVRLGSRVNGPPPDADAVVVATGVVPRRIDVPGAGGPHVHSYATLLDPDGPAPETPGAVAIIGAGGIGVDVAHLLSHPRDADPVNAFYADHRLAPPGVAVADHDPASPRPVTLLRRGAGRPGAAIGPTTRWAVLGALQRAGVAVLTGVHYEAIVPGAVQIRDRDGERRRVAADTVVVCAGQEPERRLAEALAATRTPHLVLGGAAGSGEFDAERAFRQGTEVPPRLAALFGG